MKSAFLKNTIWAFFGQFGYMILGLTGNIVLARLLNPSDFGQLGILMFFVLIANVLVESGFNGALIRKNDVQKIDYSTIFVFNLVVSVSLYILLVLSADGISAFYNSPSLSLMIYVIGLVLIFNSFQITQNAKLVKEMRFKERAIYKFISLLLATITSIYLAYQGFGIWALIALQVLSSFFFTLILFFKVENAFFFRFSKESFKEMYAFGLNTTLASVINSGFENSYQLILGKHFSMNQVGIYYQAKTLQDVADTLYKNVIQNVFYSKLSRYQEDLQLFKKRHLQITIYTTVVTGLSTLIVSSFAKDIILIVYGEKWVESAFFLQLLSIASFFYIIEVLNRNIFKIFNKTRQILFLEIFKKIIQSITIIIGIYYQRIDFLLFGYVITAFVSLMINYYYSSKVVKGIDFKEFKSLILVLMIISIFYCILNLINANVILNYLIVALEVAITIILYIFIIIKSKIINIGEIISLLRKN